MNLLAAPLLLADASVYLHFPILVVLVNLVYSATRYDDWRSILSHALRGMVYILVFLGVVFVVLFSLSSIIPRWL